MWRNLSNFVMFVLEQRILVIALMVSFNHRRSMHPCDIQFPWTLSQIFHLLILMIPFWWWWIIWQKMIHFIPYTKTIINERRTMSFLDHVFQYHGLLNDIIFYHGLQFAFKFPNQLFELLNMKVKLSSIFHP